MKNFLAFAITRVDSLRGWRGKLACFLAGAASVTAFAPLYAWPVLFITLPLVFLMLDKARHWRSAALYGWAFGYGYTMAGTFWIANALLVDAEKFGWLVPVSILGLSLVMAIWFAVFGALYRLWRAELLLHNLIRFTVLWVLVEYARSWGMFGFPWNLLGSAALASERIAQLAALIGPYGLGGVVCALALVPVLWLRPASPRLRQYSTIVALLVLIAAYGWGMVRMPETAPLSKTRVRIVQANIPQTLKWSPEGRFEAARLYTGLSQLQTDGPVPPVILWPETAVPYTLRPGSSLPQELATLLPPGGTLLTGTVRAEGEGEDYRLYNSVVAIDAAGNARAQYDKSQLVPFGEFVPLRSILPLDKITPGAVDFSRGVGAETITLPQVPPFSPLVCYEVIFPWLAVNRDARPQWMFNATNDAWYGETSGPYQHFAAARLRAIEQGLPMVRAANTGISAVIDPYGRVLKQLPLNSRGIIDQGLPQALPPTLYAGWGEMVTLILLVLCSFCTGLSCFRRKK